MNALAFRELWPTLAAMSDVTQLLSAIDRGDRQAAGELPFPNQTSEASVTLALSTLLARRLAKGYP